MFQSRYRVTFSLLRSNNLPAIPTLERTLKEQIRRCGKRLILLKDMSVERKNKGKEDSRVGRFHCGYKQEPDSKGGV